MRTLVRPLAGWLLPVGAAWLALMPARSSAQGWTRLTSGYETTPTPTRLRAVAFASETTGWVCGDGGLLLSTTDGGATWTPRPTGSTQQLNALAFPTASIGYAVGVGGTILKTTDAGLTWTAQTSGTPIELTGVSFANALVGVAVGTGTGAAGGAETIRRTTDGGATWTTQTTTGTTGTAQPLTAVFLRDANNGYATGRGGSIFVTTNGGSTPWTRLTLTGTSLQGGDVSTGRWQSVYFTSASTGFVVGEPRAGLVRRTTNGGLTAADWPEIPTPIVATANDVPRMQSVHFGSATQGFVVGNAAHILRTVDGGATWAMLANPAQGTMPLGLNSVFAPSPTVAYTVGDAGTILKFAAVGTGTRQAQRLPVAAYPQPASSTVVFETALSHPDRLTLVVSNQLGQTVATQELGAVAAGPHQHRWAVPTALADGLYLYELRGSSQVAAGKLLVQH